MNEEKEIALYSLLDGLGVFVYDLSAEDIEAEIYARDLYFFEMISDCDFSQLCDFCQNQQEKEYYIAVLELLRKLYSNESEFSVRYVKKSKEWRQVFCMVDKLRSKK